MNKNTREVASIRPDYLGFIFWEPSKRYFDDTLPDIPHSIQKIGVFVNAPLEEIVKKVNRYGLLLVQLHGKETKEYCNALQKKVPQIEIIKVFTIKDDFNFNVLKEFEEVCDYFLFDTKGKLPGGNGYTFDWKILEQYPSTKPYFLSGGIGLEEIDALTEFLRTPTARYCYAIDVNSKFETGPGLKNIKKLKEFMALLTDNNQLNTNDNELSR
ncbi:phosphoribosylanthranilate isomerase [Maribacter sp. 2304DJ31-5]|uniref:phosphoribosylanthranilate isomerase n=1 Tax=Maribacter sp. 2304DJ31-5 TaxID=3386273 RepID=UPI0039BC735C